MKRRVFTILIFLLLGAIINVAVAWACAAWAPFTVEANRPIEVQHVQMVEAGGEECLGDAVYFVSGIGVKVDVVSLTDALALTRRQEYAEQVARERGLLVNLLIRMSSLHRWQAG